MKVSRQLRTYVKIYHTIGMKGGTYYIIIDQKMYEITQQLKQLCPSHFKQKPAVLLNYNKNTYPAGQNWPGRYLTVKCINHIIGVKVFYSELPVTTCGPEFNFLMLSEHQYFFLSGGTNKCIIYHELGAERDIDFGGEKQILERQICELSIEKK